MSGDSRSARLPPEGLPGLDPAWSRLVSVVGTDGVSAEWHVLDSGPAKPAYGTVLCVHGNPTWSYLWRRLVAEPPVGWRVIAPDQLGMGFSERPVRPRRLAERIDDLERLTDALGLDGPVVLVAHDWGGPIGLGWALRRTDRLAGVVLANTAVHQPASRAAPTVIRLARSNALRELVCVLTPTFVRATTVVSAPAGGPRIPKAVRDAFAAPYATANRRRAVGDFVEDIPLEPEHPSASALRAVQDGLGELGDTPVLFVWGPRDPVFGDHHLRDLRRRLPHADVHRFEGSGHLVTEGAPGAIDAVRRWVDDLIMTRPVLATGGSAADRAGAPRRLVGESTGEALTRRSEHIFTPVDSPTDPPEPAPAGPRSSTLAADIAAVRDPGASAITALAGDRAAISFGDLERRVGTLAAGLAAHGVQQGDRVALLIPPGPDLAAAAYACWRAGAVVVVADAGLGVPKLGRALRSADPKIILGIGRGLAAARVLRVPGERILVGHSRATRALGADVTLDDLERLGADRESPPAPSHDAECAVLFTSGATGPPKGVVYRHHQASAQVAAVGKTCKITPNDRLVAAFAPFALYGPLLGIGSVIPDVDVTRPGRLTATALAEAVAAIEGTVIFASPAALRNVVRTADALTAGNRAALGGVRHALSAGAPVPVELLRAVREVLPAAELHTPYGMTEALPISTISLTELEQVGSGNGVCVGHPLDGVDVMISPLTPSGEATEPPISATGVTGEICVRAEHVKDRYDRLWAIERSSSRDAGWHRTGDVGHLDPAGLLWVEGRLAHVITTADGPVTPVGIERRVEQLSDVRLAAAVGVGPPGTQQVVVVVEKVDHRGPALADRELTQSARSVVDLPVSVVLVTSTLPVDIRHQSKIDRALVARWAERVLSGDRAGRRP